MQEEATQLILALVQGQDHKLDQQDAKLDSITGEVKETQRLQRITNGQVANHKTRLELLEATASINAAAAAATVVEEARIRRTSRERWKDRSITVAASLGTATVAAALAGWHPFG